MEQSFILKQYGSISLFEQNNMTAEERAWWVQRLDKEAKDRKSEYDKVKSKK